MRQPGGNITGVSIMGTELDAKRLEILAELLPARSTVLLLADPTTHRESRPALEATAAALGLTLREAVVGTPEQIEGHCGKQKTAEPPGSTCCHPRCCLHCEEESSAWRRSLDYLRCINGRKRQTRAV